MKPSRKVFKPSRKVFKPSRKVAKAWDEAGNWDECVKTAFHEAGHAVAHAFFDMRFGRLSIIPEVKGQLRNYGSLSGSETDSAWFFKDMLGDPSVMARQAMHHRSKMLFLHAGPAAEHKRVHGNDKDYAMHGIPDMLAWECIYRERAGQKDDLDDVMEDVWAEPPRGTDAELLLQFAWLIRQQEPQHSMEGILYETARWTNEMLAIPEVWNAVEQVARLLLKHGTLEGDEGCPVHDAVEPIWGLAFRHPAYVNPIWTR